jgi:large subunit ribosomal protein L25
MTIENKLSVVKRKDLGSTACRRMRREGRIPGVVYGHQVDPVAVEVTREALAPLIKAGTRVVDLDIEGTTETVMFRDVQWDVFGSTVNHVDLLRIDRNERVEVEVPVVLKGTAAGVLAGGVLDHHLHSVTLECLAVQIPDGIPVKVADLKIGDVIHVSDLELPPNTKVMNEPETVVVQVKEVVVSEEAAAEGAEPGPTEPEVVGRKAKETEEEEEDKAKK